MGQLSQLVLLASILTSCISYSIDSTNTVQVPEPPVEPSESDSSEFPVEFMNNLIASLSPAEQEELLKPTILGESNLEQRDGNTDKTPCLRYQDTRNYHIVKATDGEKYYVITNRTEKYQPIIHYACDEVNSIDNKCEPAKPQKFAGYCCHQLKTTVSLYVIPLPISHLEVRNRHLFLKGTNEKYDFYKIVKKDVFMNSDCVCDQYRPEIVYDYNDFSCPRPNSEYF